MDQLFEILLALAVVVLPLLLVWFVIARRLDEPRRAPPHAKAPSK